MMVDEEFGKVDHPESASATQDTQVVEYHSLWTARAELVARPFVSKPQTRPLKDRRPLSPFPPRARLSRSAPSLTRPGSGLRAKNKRRLMLHSHLAWAEIDEIDMGQTFRQ